MITIKMIKTLRLMLYRMKIQVTHLTQSPVEEDSAPEQSQPAEVSASRTLVSFRNMHR